MTQSTQPLENFLTTVELFHVLSPLSFEELPIHGSNRQAYLDFISSLNLSISIAQISVFKVKYLQGSVHFGWALSLISTEFRGL